MDVSFFRSFFGGDHGVQITPEGKHSLYLSLEYRI
jgi:hypothetical protein